MVASATSVAQMKERAEMAEKLYADLLADYIIIRSILGGRLDQRKGEHTGTTLYGLDGKMWFTDADSTIDNALREWRKTHET